MFLSYILRRTSGDTASCDISWSTYEKHGYTNLSYYSETYFSCLGNLFLLFIGILLWLRVE